ncbi:MAG: caspase family protein [Xanthomonadaceae bacterium]|nr:caspase family protein [Xanthomonadaceae bacterium]MDE1961225.1 caspase family protein [Xanthomonadaceae bacterium]MDE2083868.1 caspase family protein [Xanthomonadaceae bacterium]MDE2258571.1 caspase family protein [Xanthomonadaceae bacterium]
MFVSFRGGLRPLAVAIGFLCVAVAGFSVPATPAHATVTTRNPEDLLIVDCLLPGQVRKLGRSATFMSARRPIRTTQADCEIRGGEYVSYDRANYQTALKVWMGQAESGDADAQNYVGEIYLKGLGTEPDYARAREWFEKAAAQGNKRARINLGYLYEQGLGVPKDIAKALNLYGEASGVDNDKLVFASTVTAQVREAQNESTALREQLAAEQQKSAQLRAQVGKLQSELQRKQQNYQKSQSELDNVRRKLDAEQARVGIDTNPDFVKLQTETRAREKDLTVQRDALKSQQDASAKQLADAEARIAKLKAQEQDLLARQSSPDNDQALTVLRVSAAQMDTALRESRERMQQVQKQMAQNDQQRQEALAKFDQARAQLALEHAQNENAKQLLKLMEAQLSEKRQELASQRTQMASLQSQIDSAKYTSLPAGFTTASLTGDLRVEILQPALAMTRGLNKPAASVPPAQNGIDVIGRVQAPAGLTSVTLNGQTVPVDAGGLFKTHVALAGGNDTAVRVAASDKTGGEAVLDFMLVPGPGGKAVRESAPSGQSLPSGVRLGKYYALIIGNDNYAAFPALASAADDAKAVAGVLQSRYGYDVKLLANANRFEILSALNDMREALTDKDNLLVYYAGHGEIDSSRQGYWLPVDAQLNQPNSWISNRAISDILTTMQARHVLVIADSCYSGTMTRSALATFGGGMADNVWGDWVKAMVAGRSRTALTSGGVQPVADAASKGGHSMFATALLTVLRDNNQLLTGQELFREIAASMALRSANAGLQQAPEYAPIQFAGHEAGEFFLMPENGGRKTATLNVPGGDGV